LDRFHRGLQAPAGRLHLEMGMQSLEDGMTVRLNLQITSATKSALSGHWLIAAHEQRRFPALQHKS
jgi:hypothetical protein